MPKLRRSISLKRIHLSTNSSFVKHHGISRIFKTCFPSLYSLLPHLCPLSNSHITALSSFCLEAIIQITHRKSLPYPHSLATLSTSFTHFIAISHFHPISFL